MTAFAPRDIGRITLVICMMTGIFATGIVLHAIFSPHGLYGLTEYDDAVYLGASVRLVSGIFPYRDFVFLQPPGIMLVLAPVAAIGRAIGTREAMEIARIFTAVMGGLNAFLVAYALRHRGPLAALIGGGVLAIFPTAYFADHTALLEPYAIFFSLLALNCVFHRGEIASSRRLVFAGALLGVAMSVKLWAVVLLAVFMVCVAKRTWRAAGTLVTSAATSFAVICLPFFVSAPSRFWHDVVSAQLTRQTTAVTPFTMRLFSVVGLRGLSVHLTYRHSRDLAYFVAAVLLGVVIVGCLWPILRRSAGRFEACCLLAMVTTSAILFVPTEFFPHYAYFSAPFIALCLGCAAGEAFAALARLIGRTPRPLRQMTAIATTVVVAFGMVFPTVVIVRDEMHYQRSALRHGPQNFAPIEAAIPAGACVISDAPGLILEANRFISSRANCPAIVDGGGTWFAYDPDTAEGKLGPGDKTLVAAWSRWFSEANYVVLSRPTTFRIPWTTALRAEFNATYRPLGIRNLAIYEHVRSKRQRRSVL